MPADEIRHVAIAAGHERRVPEHLRQVWRATSHRGESAHSDRFPVPAVGKCAVGLARPQLNAPIRRLDRLRSPAIGLILQARSAILTTSHC